MTDLTIPETPRLKAARKAKVAAVTLVTNYNKDRPVDNTNYADFLDGAITEEIAASIEAAFLQYHIIKLPSQRGDGG